MSDLSLRPGLSLGPYPQRRDRLAQRRRTGLLTRGASGRRGRPQAAVDEIRQWESALQDYDDRALDAVVRELRARLVRRGMSAELIREAFAVVREVAARALDRRHSDEQLAAGWLVLQGRLVEMPVIADRAFVNSLAACTAAMAGVPVHVVTADDSLAERDWERMRPLYQRLGLTSANVVAGMAPELRRDAYAADIAHTTGRHLARDYLHDCVEMGSEPGILRMHYRQIQQRLNGGGAGTLLLRGLCFAIVDEADSVLVDQAQVPAVLGNAEAGGEPPASPDDDAARDSRPAPESPPDPVGLAVAATPAYRASLCYQKFYGRYLRLGGTASTLTEVAGELSRVYGVDVVSIKARRRAWRVALRTRVYRDDSDKHRAVVARIEQLERARRPVLISTGSAAEVGRVSAWLRQKRIEHRVVDASPDRETSAAGQGCLVTITVGAAAPISALEVDQSLAAQDGLCVISIGLPGSRRLERRLAELAIARGGSAVSILSLQDRVLRAYAPHGLLDFLAGRCAVGKPLRGALARLLPRLAQRARERDRRRRRDALLKSDPDIG